MRFQFFIIGILLTLSIALAGCSGNQPAANANSPAANAPQANGSTNSPANSGLETIKKTPEPTSNEAPTLGPVFKAYCDAIAKKDEAAVRKAYSQATLKTLEADMKEEGQKSLIKYLETDQTSECSVRNEKIEGDRGIAEVKTKGAPNGFKIVFIKENGEWKLTNEIPEIPKSNPPATAPAAPPAAPEKNPKPNANK